MDLYSYRYLLDGILLLLIVIKTVHFVKNKNYNWKVYHWIYFSEYNIKGSTSNDRAKLKKKQNLFSLIILLVLVIDLVVMLLFKPL